MFTQRLTINYRDGRTAEVVTDQGDIAEFELWAMRRGMKAPAPDQTVMMAAPITFLRFAAWAASHRGNTPRPDFDLWTQDVAEVTPDDQEEADPTPAITPGA